MLRVVVGSLVLSTLAAAQDGDARAEVRGALEAQAPLPSKPMGLPGAAAPAPGREAKVRAAESARLRAAEALKGNRGRELLQGAAKEERGNLGKAGESAKGQARADEVRKNNRGGKPPPRP